MRVQMITASLIIYCLLTACSKAQENNEEPNPATEPPVETEAANTTYKPAFTGQTRVNGMRTTMAYQGKVINSSLASPWGITVLPDGRLLITEKGGTMRLLTTEGVASAAITGLPAVNASGQGGLLGLCVDPAFNSNRMVYWVFSENTTGGTLTAVAKGRLSDDERKIENASIIYRANPAANSTAHYGGRILFDKSGNLLISTGERSILATRPSAQSVSSGLGKILRITTSGAAAAGNPSFSGGLPELYSIGHRNPQGMAFHPTTGELWASEHGPRGGDEINRVVPGANYGWPTITYGIEYGGQPIGNAIQVSQGLEQPVYYWDPVISPSGMTFYKGSRIPEWENNLFVTSLSATHVVRLQIKDNKVIGEERLLASENQRFRDIVQGKDEALYAVTDGGRLYRIDR